MDFPDPDVIFVDDVYYMISTTMHFLPGGQILRSYDLIHWEHAAYVFDRLDSTPAQRLEGDGYVYGKGMWAASLRYHEGKFYVVFVCNDTGKTYLYQASQIEGPWEKSEIDGFYHDASLLFDDDGRIYIVYGNTEIYLTELDSGLKGPKKGGSHRLIVKDVDKPRLGYEGSHFYKINGRYYLFLIHSLQEKWRRVEACFCADSLEGEFRGGDIFNDDMGFRESGVAQGGIVCGVDGIWNGVLFQDSGAVGRIPVVVPVSWENDLPVMGIDGKAPFLLSLPDSRPGHEYAPLCGSDDFKYGFPWKEKVCTPDRRREFGCFGLRSFWQFNHEPDLSLVQRMEETGALWITTDKLSRNVNHAKNTITQRMYFPSCAAEVTLDGSELKDGDRAGLVALQGDYCWVGLEKKDGRLYEVMVSHTSTEGPWDLSPVEGETIEARPIEGEKLEVRLQVVFAEKDDQAECLTKQNGEWTKIGRPHALRFRLDHFTGARFGLFMYSQKEYGGKAGFSAFRYEKDEV